MQQELPYFNAFTKIDGIGAQKIKQLYRHFGSLERAWRASRTALQQSGLQDKVIGNFLEQKINIDPAREYAKLTDASIELIPFDDTRYPKLLKETHGYPAALYQRGDFDLNIAPLITVVGSRKYSSYGAQTTRFIVRELVASGVAIVSGLALGIDAIAHRAALENGGATVAVLGSSPDDNNIEPRHNFALAQEIMQHGCLLSEYPVETPPTAFTFPARNRIMAGISLGTVIIEAGDKSGTLITAGYTLDCNRELFAVPGPIFSPTSAGTHELIKRGAKLVSNVNDILEELNLYLEKRGNSKLEAKPDTEEEKLLLGALTFEPTSIDKLAKVSKLETAVVSSTLTMMELKGWIKNIGGQNYIKCV